VSATTEPEAAFEPMSQPSLVDLVETSLREAIFEGRLRPGDRVSDARIAAEMGISRAPVREAIRHLAVRGLLREEPRRGAFVARLSRSGASEIYDCRRALEGLAARCVAVSDERDDHVARLRLLIGEMAEHGRTGDVLGMAETDQRFHLSLCEMAGNNWLLRLYGQLSDQTRLMQTIDQLAHEGQDHLANIALHEPIVDAIASGDPVRAEQAILAHIDLSERLFLDEVPDLADA